MDQENDSLHEKVSETERKEYIAFLIKLGHLSVD